MLAPSNQREIVEALRQCLREGSGTASPEFPSGLAGKLPRTFRRGTLVEYLADSGSGAALVALLAAREACREGETLAVVDRSRTFYPPAAARFGFHQDSILIRPQSRKDELWALHQTLRCPGVGAVLCWLDRLEQRAFRGLQLAAEQGGAAGLFIRPTSVRGLPTWSDMQLLLEALPSEKQRRVRIEVIRSRAGGEGVHDILELDDESPSLKATHSLSMVSQLAAATGSIGTSRA
jgi:hypothetical protein